MGRVPGLGWFWGRFWRDRRSALVRSASMRACSVCMTCSKIPLVPELDELLLLAGELVQAALKAARALLDRESQDQGFDCFCT
jgi:hypothetical protein